jgi:hypothetical protein
MKVTWLGDPEDESQKDTETLGHRFYKGKPVEIPDNDPNRSKFINNPAFETDSKEEKAMDRAEEEAEKAEAEVQKEREKEAARLAKEAEAKAKADAKAKAEADAKAKK